jgi:hypothetical protein
VGVSLNLRSVQPPVAASLSPKKSEQKVSAYIALKRAHLLVLHSMYVIWLGASLWKQQWLEVLICHGATFAQLWLSYLVQTLGHRLFVHHENNLGWTGSLPLLLLIGLYLDLLHVPGTRAFKAQHDTGQRNQHESLPNKSSEEESDSPTCSPSDVYKWWTPAFLRTDCTKWASISIQVLQYAAIAGVYVIAPVGLLLPLLVLTPLFWSYMWVLLHSSVHRPSSVGKYQNFTVTSYERGAYNWSWKILQIWTWGESLHNNHHHNMKLVCFAQAPGEIDLGFTVIKLLKCAGLVQKRKKWWKTNRCFGI